MKTHRLLPARMLQLTALGLVLLAMLIVACGTPPPAPTEAPQRHPIGGEAPSAGPAPTQPSDGADPTPTPTAVPLPTQPSDGADLTPTPTAAPTSTPAPGPTAVPAVSPLPVAAPTPVLSRPPIIVSDNKALMEESRSEGARDTQLAIQAAGQAQSAVADGTPPPQGYPAPSALHYTSNQPAYDLTIFKNYGVNSFVSTTSDPLSTFAMDVDTASYSVMRRFLRDGHLPPPEAVRLEEFVNYFDQGYQPPEEGAFAIHVEGSPHPFSQDGHWLLRVGIQGREVPVEERMDASLVFVIDVSGSMSRENRLETVKQSLSFLVGQLGEEDRVGIVIYGSRGSVLLEPTGGALKEEIMSAINRLTPGGSTNAAEGLVLGYEMAIGQVEPGRITRVILLSDGVANVGPTRSDSILSLVRKYVDEDVALSTVGFGMGNFNDVLMEQLADDGNGSYYYVDNLAEAHRVFVENLTGTLQVIARDAKVQVDFNPEAVRHYRLMGYENRKVADEDFRNDSVDAGEVGAGHSVTALYELELHPGAEGPLGTVHLRYQDPETYQFLETSREFYTEELVLRPEETSLRFQLSAAVAEYAELLRQNPWSHAQNVKGVLYAAERLHELAPEDPDVAEFFHLVSRAAQIWYPRPPVIQCGPRHHNQNDYPCKPIDR